MGRRFLKRPLCAPGRLVFFTIFNKSSDASCSFVNLSLQMQERRICVIPFGFTKALINNPAWDAWAQISAVSQHANANMFWHRPAARVERPPGRRRRAHTRMKPFQWQADAAQCEGGVIWEINRWWERETVTTAACSLWDNVLALFGWHQTGKKTTLD